MDIYDLFISCLLDSCGPAWTPVEFDPADILFATITPFSRRHVGPNEGAVSVGPFGATEWGFGAVPGPWHLRRFLWRRLRRAGVSVRRPAGILAPSAFVGGFLRLSASLECGTSRNREGLAP